MGSTQNFRLDNKKKIYKIKKKTQIPLKLWLYSPLHFSVQNLQLNTLENPKLKYEWITRLILGLV
jgi:hypothetical protein